MSVFVVYARFLTYLPSSLGGCHPTQTPQALQVITGLLLLLLLLQNYVSYCFITSTTFVLTLLDKTLLSSQCSIGSI